MATINVPADFPTIQAAINAAIAGDTIIVAAGSYEEQINVNKTLTLLGAKAGIDARTRVQTGESIIFFDTIAVGDGVVRLNATDIIIDGFTINSNPILTGSAAIISGDSGVFPPATATVDVTGVQIINNVITNNANGVAISSIEGAPKPVNYLVQYNYFQNNSGAGSSGRGVIISNLGNPNPTNVIVNQNLFNGSNTGFTVTLSRCDDSEASYNISNIDSGILILGNNLTLNKNVLYQTTTDSIILNNTNIVSITNNLVFNSSGIGINLNSSNTNTTITSNCIQNSTTRGILINANGINSGVVINNNNIINNTTAGLAKINLQYTGTVDATNNYWGSNTGPNYNGTGPGTGQPITETGVQQIIFEPFLENAINCPSPIIVNKTTTSVNVPPGNPVQFTYEIVVLPDDVPFTLTSVLDQLPQLNSGNQWTIASQVPANTFIVTVGNPQFLTYNGVLPATLAPGTYTVTIEADTNVLDAGQTLNNDATTEISIASLAQSYSRLAVASVLICVHSSSEISMADDSKKKIMDIQPGDQVITAEGQMARVIENVECVDGIYNRYYGACIIFEKDSVAPGIPSDRFAIDANHPMALKSNSDLKPAREYLNEKTIYKTYWDEAKNLLSGPNRRYDLILENGSTYVSNGIIVQSRKSHLEPGYDYNGGDYVDKK